MLCLEIIIQDHTTLRRSLSVLDGMVQRLEEGARIEIADVAAVLTFLRRFGDEYHQRVEEQVLFPALLSAVPLESPLRFMLIALPLAGQVAGFSGPDDDGDGLPDDFEQAVLEKFKPTWKISPTDCNIQPAEFVPDILNPTVKDQNGTIYGQVFIRGTNALGFFVEAHFYDLWAADCGYINSHLLDAEHVSVLIRAIDPSQPLSEWHEAESGLSDR